MLAFVNLLTHGKSTCRLKFYLVKYKAHFGLSTQSTLECILIIVVFSIFQYLKYTSLHLNLNCLKNYRCKNPHLATKELPFTVSRQNKTMLANSDEGLATEFANSPNSLGLCVWGHFFRHLNCFKLPRSA